MDLVEFLDAVGVVYSCLSFRIRIFHIRTISQKVPEIVAPKKYHNFKP